MSAERTSPRLIPVLDLMNGKVVRAVGGRRDEYRPVVSTLTPSTEPVEVAMALLAATVGVPLARAMRTRYGTTILLGLTGVFSLVLGFVWGWPIVHAMVVRRLA